MNLIRWPALKCLVGMRFRSYLLGERVVGVVPGTGDLGWGWEGKCASKLDLLLPDTPNRFPSEQSCFDLFYILMISYQILKNNSFFFKFKNHALEDMLAYMILEYDGVPGWLSSLSVCLQRRS